MLLTLICMPTEKTVKESNTLTTRSGGCFWIIALLCEFNSSFSPFVFSKISAINMYYFKNKCISKRYTEDT